MYRRKSKRALFIRHLLIYSLMFLSVIVLVGLVMLFVLGYRLDGENKLAQGSLVQFESKPTGATVLIDDNPLSVRTPTKSTVPEGSHIFTINRNGYETWQKTVTLTAGTLTWINYPILIPTDRPTDKVRTYDSLVDAQASPDRRHMLLQPARDEPVFDLVGLESNDVNSVSVTLPAAAYTKPKDADTQAFYIDRWDSAGRYVVLRHTFDKKTEWILFDTDQPNRSTNITDLLDIAIQQLRFSGNSGNLFFARLSDGTIRKLDIGAGTISRALVTGADNFEVYESNVIAYTARTLTASGQLYTAGIYKDGETSAVELFSTTSDAGLRIATTRYFNEYYTAISSDKTVTIYKGDYPRSSDDVPDLQTFATFTFPDKVETLRFSREGTYLLIQSGKDVMSYDIERKTGFSSLISTDADITQPLRWIAPAYLYSDYGGDLVLREFDGTNSHVINKSAPGFGVTFTGNYRYLYSIIENADDSYSLQRVKMVID